jgi:hypothetical protein
MDKIKRSTIAPKRLGPLRILARKVSPRSRRGGSYGVFPTRIFGDRYAAPISRTYISQLTSRASLDKKSLRDFLNLPGCLTMTLS